MSAGDPRLEIPPGDGIPPRWMTARSIALGVADTRRHVLRMSAAWPGPGAMVDKLERDEAWLVTYACANGLTLGPVRPK